MNLDGRRWAPKKINKRRNAFHGLVAREEEPFPRYIRSSAPAGRRDVTPRRVRSAPKVKRKEKKKWNEKRKTSVVFSPAPTVDLVKTRRVKWETFDDGCRH